MMKFLRRFCVVLSVSLTALPAEAGLFDQPDPLMQSRLNAIVENGDNRLAGAALIVMVGDKVVFKGAAGCAQFRKKAPQKCRRPMRPDTKLRAASISKMAAAFAALRLEQEGVLNLDRDISDYLGWELRNPAFPDAPVTARHLMAHLSSLRDPEKYWVEAPGRLQEFIASKPEIFVAAGGESNMAPGAYFSYANINYGLLGAVMEKAAGMRFDDIVRTRLLAPMKLDAGFNWSGVSKKARARGAVLYRKEGDIWAAQMDDAAILKDHRPYFLTQHGLDADAYLDAYKPGENATLFSPQGGLRASVSDLVKLVRLIGSDDTLASAAAMQWAYGDAAPNGDTDDGFFHHYGLGVQILTGDEAGFSGKTLYGHSGEAYGLYSGAWLVKGADDEKDMAFAFAVTGTERPPAKGAHSGFNAVEEKLTHLAQQAAAAPRKHGHHDDDPRPYDQDRNAMSDVDAALDAARESGKRVLLVLGANWCHDSRGLAGKFEEPSLAALIEANYELVYVDVGRRDRNLDVGARFGVPQIFGTPTVLILSPEGVLLNADSVHEWRTADAKSFDETFDYFRSFARP